MADAQTIGIGARKGGVGKTVTTYHLGRAAARAGRRVLLVDMDPQGSLTTLVAYNDGVPLARDSIGVADLLMGEATLAEIVVPTIFDGVRLAPTPRNPGLELVRTELAVLARSEHEQACTVLREALEDLEQYDLVIIDMPPAIDLLTINALTASDGVVVIAEPKLLAVEQIDDYLTTVENVVSTYNPTLKFLGAVVSKYEAGTITSKEKADEVAAVLPVLAIIAKRAAINDSTEASVGLDAWPSRSSAELTALYDQLLTKIEGSLS